MAIQKPAPLMVGNKAYYSLTSYDPVEVEVIVPFITDEEVELALGSLLEDEGGTVENLSDPDWIAKHFEGLRSTDELHRVLRVGGTDLLPLKDDLAAGLVIDSCQALDQCGFSCPVLPEKRMHFPSPQGEVHFVKRLYCRKLHFYLLHLENDFVRQIHTSSS